MFRDILRNATSEREIERTGEKKREIERERNKVREKVRKGGKKLQLSCQYEERNVDQGREFENLS